MIDGIKAAANLIGGTLSNDEPDDKNLISDKHVDAVDQLKSKAKGEDLLSPADRDRDASKIKIPKSHIDIGNGAPLSSIQPDDSKVSNRTKTGFSWNDRVNLSLGKGLSDETLTNSLMGFNHRIVTQQLPMHKQIEGLAFLTRPDINLSLDNIANSRFFSDLAACPPGSVEWSVLAALDPECEVTNPNKAYGYPAYAQIPFDNLQAFLPVFTSTVREISGFPDQTIDVWMSEEGAYREQYGMTDSVFEVNNSYTLNVTFNNILGEPMMLYIRGLLEWSSGVRRNIFRPKTYNQIGRRIDYQSRLYIFKFDPLGKRITNWGAAMVCWPLNDNEGSLLNYTSLTSIQDNTRELSIQFQCIGARYRDTLLFESFNSVVGMFNPDLVPDYTGSTNFHYDTYVPVGGQGYVEIPQEELAMYNWKGYPIIDTDTRSFRWYIPVDEYYRVRKRGGFK